MRIVVVTPTTGRDMAALERCAESVEAQRFPEGNTLEHVFVADGVDAGCLGLAQEAITLPQSAADAGATPRAVGSAYAVGALKADVIAFLDDDNTYAPEHIASALELIRQGAVVVSSLRWMVSADTGDRMYVDQGDSDGTAFADTNTVVLAGDAAKFASTWNWFAGTSGADRVFWDRLKHSFTGRMACTMLPTVHYSTRWAVHYNYANEHGEPIWTPPDPCKFVTQDERGVRGAVTCGRTWNEVTKRWEAVR